MAERGARLGALVALALAATSCVAAETRPALTASGSVAPAPPVAAPPQAPVLPSGGEPRLVASMAPPPAAAPRTANALLAPRPDTLIGLTPGELARLFGEPPFARRDHGAEIWQYRHRDCIVDLFLYAERGVARVRHVELRAVDLARRGPAGGEAEACLAGLARAARG